MTAFWQGKAVLVTGAARGLGAALCERFSAAGAAVAAVDLRAEAARSMAERLRGPFLMIKHVVGTRAADTS